MLALSSNSNDAIAVHFCIVAPCTDIYNSLIRDEPYPRVDGPRLDKLPIEHDDFILVLYMPYYHIEAETRCPPFR